MINFIRIFCACLLCAATLATHAQIIDSGNLGNGLTWVLTTDGTLTIAKTGEGNGEMPDYYSMSQQPWASNRDLLTTLVIGEGVTSIGHYAFRDCSGFKGSLTLPEGLTNIGQYAFSRCSGFTGSLTLPEGITSIGSNAFYGCSGFTGSLTLPAGITSIESSISFLKYHI